MTIKEETLENQDTAMPPAQDVAEVGDFIDDYRIIRTVSETPTSVIYKAEQKSSKRKVAIKVIFNRPGTAMERLERPEEEVERLKHLNHPGIAAFLDIGTTSEGHCYFVNEFIRGVSLDEYVKIHKVSLKNRLSLFMKICDAVASAHQQLLLHRDLRPSKIVIDGKCNPKIAGLGVAAVTDVDVESSKEITNDPGLKQFLAYKSPEQITGKQVDIDVRSDLYSLGVILYELLTDQLPCGLDSCKNDDIVKNICKNRAKIPAAARRSIGDDLTAIVMKSLEKEPDARYKTVADLSQDLQNYFDQRPVRARPAGAFYEFRKLAARHKSRTISAVLMSAAVIGFGAHVFLTTRDAGQQRLQQERDQSAADIANLVTARDLAEQKLKDARESFKAKMAQYQDFDNTLAQLRSELARAEKAEQTLQTEMARDESKTRSAQEVSQFFISLFRNSMKSGGGIITAADMLDVGVERAARQFNDRPILQATLFDALGVAYQYLGQYEKAVDQIKTAVESRRRSLGESHVDTIDSMNNLASALFSQGMREEAEPLCRRIVDASSRAFGHESPKTLTAMNNLGMTLFALDKLSEAEDILRRTLEGRRRVLGGDHRKTVTTAHNLGRVLFDQGKAEEAADLFRESLQAKRHQLGSDHPEVAVIMLQLAEAMMEQGNSATAEPMVKECLDIRRRILSKGHWLIAYTKSTLGKCLADQRQFEKAEPLMISNHARIAASRGKNDAFTQRSLQRIVDLYEAWGQPEKAASYRADLRKRPE